MGYGVSVCVGFTRADDHALYPSGVRRVLVTGMSGTGKSTALAELRRQGFDVVDTDEPGWTEWSDEEPGYVWREHRIAELLARDRDVPLYVSLGLSRTRDGSIRSSTPSSC
jgi:hypothetical protein